MKNLQIKATSKDLYPYLKVKTIKTQLNIIDECLSNNRAAQKQLYDMYKVKMFTLCMRYMSNRNDAEDMLQEGWIKIFKKLHTFNRKKGSFYGWARKVIVNSNLEYLRKKKLYFENIEDINPSTSYDEEHIFSSFGMEELTKILQRLPSGYRTIFNLYVIDGFSHKEIAEKLDISVSTSKTQLMKAKNILKAKVTTLRLVS